MQLLLVVWPHVEVTRKKEKISLQDSWLNIDYFLKKIDFVKIEKKRISLQSLSIDVKNSGTKIDRPS